MPLTAILNIPNLKIQNVCLIISLEYSFNLIPTYSQISNQQSLVSNQQEQGTIRLSLGKERNIPKYHVCC